MPAIHHATVQFWSGYCEGCRLWHEDLICFSNKSVDHVLCVYCQAYCLSRLLSEAPEEQVSGIITDLQEIQATRAQEEAA